jgi:AGZA family xanthine/uracil permease-like MFS transporter
MSPPTNRLPCLVRGDIDGLLGLALDNLVQLLVIVNLCTFVLGFPNELIYGTVLPGAAVSLVAGNLFYAWQARQLAKRLNRDDICALPYGINTPSVFLYIFLVMLPASIAAKQSGADDETAAFIAWQAGLLACFGSGIIECAGASIAKVLRRHAPQPALLATLAGIALGFISMPFVYQAFADPLVGLLPLGLLLMGYLAQIRPRGPLPIGCIAMLLGTGCYWLGLGQEPAGDSLSTATAHLGLHIPLPVIGELFSAIDPATMAQIASVTIAMGLMNVLGSIQNLASAAAAGDDFADAPSLAVNGGGTLLAACFGSCFPTTIYIGHPGWKALGARHGYSILNAVLMTIICCSGSVALLSAVIPQTAVLAVVVWIGIVITAQSFQTTPENFAPAVVIGLLPGLAAWGVLMLKTGLSLGGVDFTNEALPGQLAQRDLPFTGLFALEQGALFTAIIWSAAAVAWIDRSYTRAALWLGGGAILSLTGLMHGFHVTPFDVTLALQPAWLWAVAYLALALLSLLIPRLTLPDEPSE